MRGRAIAVCALACVAPTTARSNPADAFGMGPRGMAMGSAQVATVDDATAGYYNPAMLVRLRDSSITIAYQAAVPQLDIGDVRTETDASRGTAIGVSMPGHVLSVPVAVGVTGYLPDQQLARIRALGVSVPRYVMYENRPQRLLLAALAAVDLGRVQIGAGIAFMTSTVGYVALQGRVGFPDANDSELQINIDVEVDEERYPHAGIAYQANPWLNLGLTYRGQVVATLDQSVRIDGDVGAEGQEPIVPDGYLDLRTISLQHFQPAQVIGGLGAQLTPSLLFAFDLGYMRWSTYENPASRVELELELRDFNDLVDLPEDDPLPPPRFSDIVIPRLGLEWRAHRSERWEVDLRGGYVYEPSPIPEQIGELNMVDSDKHIVSLGAGFQIDRMGSVIERPTSFDLTLGYAHLVSRDHRKLSPVDPIGDYRSSGRVFQASLGGRWRF